MFYYMTVPSEIGLPTKVKQFIVNHANGFMKSKYLILEFRKQTAFLV